MFDMLLKSSTLSFPGLGIGEFTINSVAFTVFGHEIAWYGVIITFGIILSAIYGLSRAKLEGISSDDMLDVILAAVIFSVIGARIYYVLFYGKKHDLPAHEKESPKVILHTLKDSIWALLMPIIVLGGIFGGIYTATEASAVAVVYALCINLFVYRDTKFSELPDIFVDASVSTATIMIMVGLSKASSYVVVTSGLPQLLLDMFSSITSSKIVILLLLNILFLIIGMLMEANAAIIMMTPILTPLLTAFGIDTLSFGIVMSFNLCIGLVTPPVGLCLLLCNQIGETSLVKTLKAMMPMLIISVVILMLITYIEPLTTFLPSLLA